MTNHPVEHIRDKTTALSQLVASATSSQVLVCVCVCEMEQVELKRRLAHKSQRRNRVFACTNTHTHTENAYNEAERFMVEAPFKGHLCAARSHTHTHTLHGSIYNHQVTMPC